MVRLSAVVFALCSLVAATASAQMVTPGLGGGAPGMAPQVPTLTRSDVEKLVAVIPELAKLGGQRPGGGGLSPGTPPSPEELQQVEALLTRFGFGFPDFFMKMTVLIATYHTLEPNEFERQLPTEQSPEVQAILTDPSVSAGDKTLLKQQIAEIQANKGAMRAQFAAMATAENQAAVKPLLAQVKKALSEAESLSKQARAKNQEAAKAARPGPRRSDAANPKP